LIFLIRFIQFLYLAAWNKTRWEVKWIA